MCSCNSMQALSMTGLQMGQQVFCADACRVHMRKLTKWSNQTNILPCECLAPSQIRDELSLF